jgi:hypothetical protein
MPIQKARLAYKNSNDRFMSCFPHEMVIFFKNKYQLTVLKNITLIKVKNHPRKKNDDKKKTS